MKLVEKKCPSCGAGLKFDDNATSVTCEYCNQTFYIQKDEKKYAKLDTAHLGDAYKFVDEVGKPIVKGLAVAHIVMTIVPFIFFLLVFIGIGFTVFKSFDQFDEEIDTIYEEVDDDFTMPEVPKLPDVDNNEAVNDDNNKDKINYVTKLSDIDSVSLDTFYDKSKSQLNHMDNMDYKVSGWSKVGSYLLVSKDGKSNNLYNVMKHTYTHKKSGKKVTLYVAVLYNNLTLNENNIVNHSFIGKTISQDIDLDGESLNFAKGYESVEKLYNAEIRSKVGDYTLEATKGMYLEN